MAQRENNLLIAKFMGLDLSPVEDMDIQLDYHSNWTSLMDVIEKIEKFKSTDGDEVKVLITGDKCEIFVNFCMPVIAIFSNNKKSAVYQASLMFIKNVMRK